MIDPKALKYTPTHEWVHQEGEVATVGITKFAVDQLVDLIHLDLGRLKVGSQVSVGETIGEIESVKAVAELYSPVAGQVAQINDDVVGNVKILSEDPYTQGWLLKIQLSEPGSAAANLLDSESYEQKIAEEHH